MKNTTKNTFKNDVLDSKKTVLVDVWAEYCGPCRAMAPILQQILDENSEIEIVKIDAQTEMDLAQQLDVTGLPTFMVYKNGKLINSHTGLITKDRLAAMLK